MEASTQVTGTDGSPLLKAVYLGRLRLARLLLEGGAYINESNCLGQTPLMVACRSKWQDQQSVSRVKMVRYLTESGADLNIQDKSGKTALMHACLERAGAEVVSLLLDSGADPSLEDHSGASALVHAVDAQDKMTLRMLVDTCKAKGKEVIIITTTADGKADGKPKTKQYLNVPPMDALEQWDHVNSPGLASPSQIELQPTSADPPHHGSAATAKQVFSFPTGQAAATSQPNSPRHYQGQEMHKASEKFAHLQRLNSEPWLQIPRSLTGLSQQKLGRSTSPVEDASSLKPLSQEEQEKLRPFAPKLTDFSSGPLTRHGSIDLREAARPNRAGRLNLQSEGNVVAGEGFGQGFGLTPGRKMSFDGLSSPHSLSHPNLHARTTTEQSMPADGNRSKLLPPSLAVSSLRNIVCRRQNLGVDHYSSDSQLSLQKAGSSDEFLRAAVDRRQLVTSRSSTFIGMLESAGAAAVASAQQAAAKLKHPGTAMETRTSGVLVSDSPSPPRQGYLPPLSQHPHTASLAGAGVLGTPTHNSHKLGLCGVSSATKLGLHPQAPAIFLKDPKSRRLLLRRHSMQTEQLKAI